MKIFYDHKIFYKQVRGGPSRLFLSLAKNLLQYDCNIKIYAPFYFNEFLNQFSKQHSDIVEGKYIKNRIKYSSKIIGLINSFLSKNKIKKETPDIYHSTYYGNSLTNLKKIPLVITVHDLVHELLLKNKGIKGLDDKSKIIHKADQIITVSQNTKNDLIHYYKINEKKISVINPGVENIFLNKNYSNYDFLNLKPYILYVGSRHGYKNAKNLLISFAKSSKLRNNIKIVFFGGENFNNEEKKFISTLNLSEKNCIQLSGDDNTLKLLYKNAEVFVYPSLYEGFGSSPLEAMNYGCPVVSSNTSCLPEIQGNASKKFDPNNIENISHALEEVIYSKEIKDNLISKGFEKVKEYSWQKCAEETMQVYKKFAR